MPDWAWFAAAGGALLLVAAMAAAWIFGRRAFERRALLRLIVRAEAVNAAAAALIDVVEQAGAAPSGDGDEGGEGSPFDPDSVERRAIAEVHSRASILVEELDHMAMPKRLVPAADALADAAFTVCDQTGKVEDGHTRLEARAALADIDIERVAAYRDKARILIAGACDVCGLDDTAVYGGGLYL